MSLKLGIVAIGVWILTGCAPAGKSGDFRASARYTKGTTGGTDSEGFSFINNGDHRVDQALIDEQPSAPASSDDVSAEPEQVEPAPKPEPSPKKTPVLRHLRDKLRQFEISRFAEGNDTEHTRFGSGHILITAFFRNENPAQFDIKKPVKIGNTITIEAKSGRFTLKGDITDSETKSIGMLTLHDSSNKEDAFIYYRAYRGKKPKVRVDSTRPMIQGSAFERQVNFLREKTFPWVHNFSVLRGSSSYVTDLVRTISVKNKANKDLPSISLSGESKETGDQDWDVEVKASDDEDGDAKAVTNARLVGNSDESTQRVFAVTLKDPESQEENTVMVEIEEENPEAPPPVDPADEPIEYVGDHFTPLPANPKQPSAPGGGSGGGTPETTEPTVVSQSTAYLISNTSLARTNKMLLDYERNRSIPGVRAAIASYQKNSGKKNQLQRFFYYANPFRSIMETIGSAYDVSPAYAYVTVIESAYFTGGQYKIERPRTKSGRLLSSALGPFQLLEGTARAQGLRVTALWKGDHNNKDDDQDDRNYFTTSACGAANYMTKLVNIFANSDTTLAVLAYKEGEGGAAAAAYCTKTRNQSCINRINHGMSGAEYGRYLKVAKNYNYTYAELDRAAMIPPRMRDYVRNKLAAYFIASDLHRYGFTPYGRSSPLKHKSVHSPYSIQDARCKSAVNSLHL